MRFFNKARLWPGACLGGQLPLPLQGDGAGSGTTVKVLTAEGQVLRFPDLSSITVADLLILTAHPHHLVCEGHPKDLLFHRARLSKLSRSYSTCDTDSTASDCSDVGGPSFLASPARRTSSLPPRPPALWRFLGLGLTLGLGLGFRLHRSSNDSSLSDRFRVFSKSRAPAAASPTPTPSGPDYFSDVGSEDGGGESYPPSTGRILSSNAELESGRVYYLLPLPRLLPDAVTESDSALSWGPAYPLTTCCCRKALKKLEQEKHGQHGKKKKKKKKKKGGKEDEVMCTSLRCSKAHGIIIMGCASSSSKINPQDSEWESGWESQSGEMSHRSSSASVGDLWRPSSFSDSSRHSLPPHWPHFADHLAAYRSHEELIRDEMAAKVARAQYRIPPAYCFRSAWRLHLPPITEGVPAVSFERDRPRPRTPSSSIRKMGPDSPRSPHHSPFLPRTFGLRSPNSQSRSPGRHSRPSPGRINRKSPIQNPRSPNLRQLSPSFSGLSPVRYGRSSSTSASIRSLDNQLTESPLHLPAPSPDRFHTISPKFRLNSPDKSPAPPAPAAGHLRHGYPSHFLLNSPDRSFSPTALPSSHRHSNSNPSSFRQPLSSCAIPPHRRHQTDASPNSHPMEYADPTPHLPTRPDQTPGHVYRDQPATHAQLAGVQPWQSPPSGVNFVISGKTWQICSPQRPDNSHSSPNSSSRTALSPGPDVFTLSSSSWPNPAPRCVPPAHPQASTPTDRLQTGLVQQSSNGRFRSTPAWKDLRQLSPVLRPVGHGGWASPSQSHDHHSQKLRGSSATSAAAFSGYGGSTW